MTSHDGNSEDVVQGLWGLFRHVFITNSEIEDEDISNEDRQTLDELTPLEILDNFRTLSDDLLKFKQVHITSEIEQLRQANKQFQEMTQKLEAESREKNRNEQQLKVIIESLQFKVDQLQHQLSPTARQLTTRDSLKDFIEPQLENTRKSDHDLEKKLADLQKHKQQSTKRIQYLEKQVRLHKSNSKKRIRPTLEIQTSVTPLPSGRQVTVQSPAQSPDKIRMKGKIIKPPQNLQNVNSPESLQHRKVQSYDLRKHSNHNTPFEDIYKKALADLRHNSPAKKPSRWPDDILKIQNKKKHKKHKSVMVRSKTAVKFYS